MSSVINAANAKRAEEAEEADAADVAVMTTRRKTYISRKLADFMSMLA